MMLDVLGTEDHSMPRLPRLDKIGRGSLFGMDKQANKRPEALCFNLSLNFDLFVLSQLLVSPQGP